MWSWVLTAIGITGWWLVGNKRRSGFAIGLLVQFLWIIYAINTEQWGFVVSAFLYGGVAYRNWKKWRPEDAQLHPARSL